MFKRSASKLSVPFTSLSTAQPRAAQLSTAQNLILAKKSASLPRLTPAESSRLGFSFMVCIYSRYSADRCSESGTSPFLQQFPRVCHGSKAINSNSISSS